VDGMKMNDISIKLIEKMENRYSDVIEKYKGMASHYQPNPIKYLLIGESPPYYDEKTDAPKYFYNAEQQSKQELRDSVREAFFYNKYKSSSAHDILTKLSEKGFFLIDSVEFPMNKIKCKELDLILEIPDNTRIKLIAACYSRLFNKIPVETPANIIVMSKNNWAIKDKLKHDFPKLIVNYTGSPFYAKKNRENFINNVRGYWKEAIECP
jgi:hypothetical protein